MAKNGYLRNKLRIDGTTFFSNTSTMLILTNTNYVYLQNLCFLFINHLSTYLYNLILCIENIPVLGGIRINKYIQVSLEVSLECSKVSQCQKKESNFSKGDEN